MQMPDQCVVVLTTLPTDADAAALARALVEARLAACVNILPPMTSIYRWRDGLEEDAERQIVIKTTREKLPGLWERLRQLHPYDVPEFIALPIADGNETYLRWIAESTGP
jgi:periplasmic divalent cation tolerance protein